MIVNKKIMKVWEKELKGKNITQVAKDANVNYRTLVSVLKTGKTIASVVNKLNAYILRERAKMKEILHIEDDKL